MGLIEILLPFSALCFEAFLHLCKLMYSKMYLNLFWLETKNEHHYHKKIYEIFHANDIDWNIVGIRHNSKPLKLSFHLKLSTAFDIFLFHIQFRFKHMRYIK